RRAGPMQNFGPSPGMRGSPTSPEQPSYGASPGQPGSPTYNPNAALPSLNNPGASTSPSTGSSASGLNAPSTSSGSSTRSGSCSGVGGTTAEAKSPTLFCRGLEGPGLSPGPSSLRNLAPTQRPTAACKIRNRGTYPALNHIPRQGHRHETHISNFG